MTLVRQSPCKVNLLLNILGRRPDGFHELETVMYPLKVHDEISFARAGQGIELSCNDSRLPTDQRNLVYRAAASFLEAAKIKDGVRMHLEKRIPLAAGLGGGSGNAAVALLGFNELFGHPLAPERIASLAASLGSDVPFFLQNKPVLATGRGEKIQPLELFPSMTGTAFLLVHPGFGIASAWAYQQLQRFPESLNSRRGRAEELITALRTQDLRTASAGFYNALEPPALEKFPLLALFQEFFREQGALGTLMSGSGSTTFALLENVEHAQRVLELFNARFGAANWTDVVEAS